MISLFYSQNVLADHLLGADFYYQCNPNGLGNCTYRVFVTRYMDCNTINVNNNSMVNYPAPGCATPTDFVQIIPTCGNAGVVNGLNTFMSINNNWVYQGAVDITPSCFTGFAGQTNCNNNPAFVIVQGLFAVTHFIDISLCDPSLQNCSLTFEYFDAARNGSYTYATNGSTPFYSAFRINLSTDNATPSYNNNASTYICNTANVPVVLNLGAPDVLIPGQTTPDIITYGLTNCREASNINMTFINGTNVANPFGIFATVGFNNTTGQLTVTPTGQALPGIGFGQIIGQFCIQTTELRNTGSGTIVVGVSFRDFVVILDDCAQGPPVAVNSPPTGINSGISNIMNGTLSQLNPLTLQACPDIPLGFTFSVRENLNFIFSPNEMLSMFISSNGGINGLSLQNGPTITGIATNVLSGNFTWSNPIPGSYNIVIGAAFNGCWETDTALFPIQITVGLPLSITKTANQPAYYASDFVTYTLAIGNSNATPVTGVTVTDLIPPQFDISTFTSPDFSPPINNQISTTVTVPPGGMTLSYTIQINEQEYNYVCDNRVVNCASIAAQGGTCNRTLTDCSEIYIIPAGMGFVSIPDGTNLSGGSIAYANQYIVLEGSLTANLANSCTFDDCIVYAEPGSGMFLSGGTFYIHNTHIFACDTMWRGISCRSGEIVIDQNSVIEDAEVAVDIIFQGDIAGNQVIATLRDAYYNKNFIGIRGVCTGTQSPFYTPSWVIVRNQINGGQLLNAYINVPAQPPHLGQSYLGMEFERVSLGLSGNEFHNINNGMWLRRSNIFSFGNRFVNVLPNAPYIFPPGSLFNRNGTGILSQGEKWNNLYVSGFGDSNTSTYSFENCKNGIISHQTETTVENNRMQCETMGIEIAVPSTLQDIDIHDNRLETQQNGILALMTDNANSVRILNNTLESGYLNNITGISAIGIGCFQDATNAEIADNHIALDRTSLGIQAQAANRVQILHNEILMNHIDNSTLIPTSLNKVGVLNEASHGATVSCNHVTGSFGNYDGTVDRPQFAYRTDNATNWTISCNDADQTPYGFSFRGICNSAENFRGNNMTEHYIGLYLPNVAVGVNDTRIGVQRDRGNQWLSMLGYRSAVCLAQDATASMIFADDNFPIYHPDVTTRIIPNIEGDWFNISPSPPYTGCTGIFGECGGGGEQFMGEGGLDSTDYRIATQSLGDSLYQEATQFRGETYLYDKLKDSLDLVPESGAIADFYNAQTGGTLEKIYQIEEMHSLLRDWQSKETLMDYQAQLAEIQQAIFYNDSTRLVTLDSLQIAGLTQERDSLTLLSDSLIALIQGIIIMESLNEQILAGTIETTNNGINETLEVEANEKAVNGIYYSTIAQDIYSFSIYQIQTIENIAFSCPASGGNAVYKARALRAFALGDTIYNDSLLCANVGVSWRKTQPKTEVLQEIMNVSLQPNPSDATINIILNIPANKEIKCEIYNTFGQSFSTFKIERDASSYILDTHRFPEGVYWLRVNEKDTYKFIVIH